MTRRPRLLTLTLVGLALATGAETVQAVNGSVRASAGAATAVVNQDQFEGKWKQFKGELKKQWGEFTDDDLLAIEGSVDKLEGKIQERYGDRREEVKRWVDEWFDHHGTRPRES
ncbi:CsbD family protein [Nitrospira defluvii]|uniref:Stress response protein (Modular protein) n=1 Tax=Nitrospira defluvii TaxID=330214 RepID=A0ABM8R1Q9_9BACT|nr:putative stress response protein (modular protein) [Nitrospira defluvii]